MKALSLLAIPLLVGCGNSAPKPPDTATTGAPSASVPTTPPVTSASVAPATSASAPAKPADTSTASGTSGVLPETKIVAFKRAADFGKADKMGMKDGELKADGKPDASFEVEIDGAAAAFFVYASDAAGEPTGQFQADSLVGTQSMPNELAKKIAGKNTSGLVVYEGDKRITSDDGSLKEISGGAHKLTVYVPNSPALAPGKAVRLLLQMPDKTVVSSAVLTK